MHATRSPSWTVLGVALLGLAGADAQQEPSLPWRTDLEAARRDAAEAGRPLLVVFQ